MQLNPIHAQGLGEQVGAQLRRLIVRGELRPGQHLVEAQLAEQLGVSRGPVRDALAQMLNEGLVEQGRRGIRVVGFSEREIRELYDVRLAVETLATSRCLERRVEVDWSTFSDALDAMESAANEQRAAEFAAADLHFHGLFYRNADNRRLVQIWEQYHPTFALLLEMATSQDADLHPSLEAHRALLQLVHDGDQAALATELTSHFYGSRQRLSRALRDTWGESER